MVDKPSLSQWSWDDELHFLIFCYGQLRLFGPYLLCLFRWEEIEELILRRAHLVGCTLRLWVVTFPRKGRRLRTRHFPIRQLCWRWDCFGFTIVGQCASQRWCPFQHSLGSVSGDIFPTILDWNVTFWNVEMSHLYGTIEVTLRIVMSHLKCHIETANVTF